MKKQLLFLTLMGAFIMGYAQQPLSPSSQSAPISRAALVAQFPKGGNVNSPLTYTIIDAPNNTYGYNVYAESRLMIQQTSIPGQPGNEGFKTKKDAITIAILVIDKMKKGEMPPTISIDEMKKLSVIK
ncbi:MAG: DUF4907 domain-containing protein [Chitinophagales bacterium]|nr:DUF4907 domain-containing protein [Chitinophagales bacterium]